MARSKKYGDELLEALRDHEEAVAYLNAALEESMLGDEESQEVLLMALRSVAEAQGGVAKLAKNAHVGRESLYKTLSANGNPEFRTLATLIRAMGLRLQFV